MKRRIITIAISIFLLLSMPVILICFGFCLPAQFSETYYAELPVMFKRLKETDGKRIIFVGNSALAFGLEGGILEKELKDYTVCPFGLYGAIGTKTMMDLSKANIGEGDVVVLSPEPIAQSMSLYFNSEYVWNSVDGHYGMLKQIVNRKEMAGGFLDYVGRKFAYYKNNSAPRPQNVYAFASFDENCNMIYDRPYNMLPLGYDNNARISFDPELIASDFIDYVNEYNKYVTKRGATLLYGFVPVNASGLQLGTTNRDIDEFYNALNERLDCEILGNPHDYILESDWFYDANVHTNSYGSIVYTERLARDLKAYFCDSSPINIVLPEKPVVPDDAPNGEDGKDAALFTYEENGSGWNITGLIEEGKSRTSIEIPDFYQGKKVLSFSSQTFAGNTVIEEIMLGRNIYGISDNSFSGCTSLERIYMPESSAPSDCNVYLALLDGAPNCRIYVPQTKINDYRNDYFWSRYGAYLIGF